MKVHLHRVYGNGFLYFPMCPEPFSARAIPPSPPFSHTSERANSQPLSSQNSWINVFFRLGIGNKRVQSNDHRYVVFEYFQYVSLSLQFLFQCFQILFCKVALGNPTIILQSTHGCNKNNCIRFQSRFATFNIKEFQHRDLLRSLPP